MQKCSNNAYKEKDKNNQKKQDKKVICDGFSCKVISDDKNIKSDKNIMIDLGIK